MTGKQLPIHIAAEQHVGKWVTFKTSQGLMRGILEKVDGQRALIKMPYADAPLHLLVGDGHDVGTAAGKQLNDFSNVAYYAPGGVGYGPGVATPYGFGWGGWWWIWIPLIFILFAAAFCW